MVVFLFKRWQTYIVRYKKVFNKVYINKHLKTTKVSDSMSLYYFFILANKERYNKNTNHLFHSNSSQRTALESQSPGHR